MELETARDNPPQSHEELRDEADDAYRNGNYAGAIALYNAALDSMERAAPNDGEGKIRILTWLALSYQKDRDFVTARRFHEAELKLARQLRDREKIADALHRLGDTYLELKNDRRAEDCLIESLKIIRSLGSGRREIPHLLFDLADIAERRKQPRVAAARFREWIQEQQARRDTDLPRGWYRLGSLAAQQKEWEAAEENFYAALVISQELGNAYWEAWCLYGLGRVAYQREKQGRAEYMAKEALCIAGPFQDRPLIARIQILQGNIAWGKEDYMTAARFYTEHIASQYGARDWSGTVCGLQNLAAACFNCDLLGFSALSFALVDALKEHPGVDYPSRFADRFRTQCRKAVSEATWQQAQERARTMSIPDALAYFSEELTEERRAAARQITNIAGKRREGDSR